MSLPPGFLDELRSRTSLSRIVGRKVAWDMRRSNPTRGDWWAPCPFHQERTASFHVDEKKGFYYCFGCHAKGDALTFLKEAENLPFMEAVELLAREAGMAMPARDPAASAEAGRRATLLEAMEQAVKYYRLQLSTAAGAAARDYLARRGLPDALRDRFEIGFAPDARSGLTQALTARGIAPEAIVEAGLAALPEGGGAPYDRFRGRIIFPIRDARGRCIGLGGRALDPGARAKYLNSPETPLFDKGRTLYNLGPARAAAAKGAPVILAEGYMDVIALAGAGFDAAVAPLGTAVTAEQLALLWRLSPEPVVALDGDAAGVRAALRLADLALPLIEPGQSLRFALMPEGMDPDDLIRQGGAAAMQAVLEAAQPMAALLWRRETEGQVFDSPERRAALDGRLSLIARRIRDPGLRQHYAEEFRSLRDRLFAALRGPARAGAAARRPGPGGDRGPAGGQGWGPAGMRGPVQPLAATRASFLAAAPEGAEDRLREAVILATLALHPDLLPRFLSDLERMEPSGADLAGLHAALLAAPPAAEAAALRAGLPAAAAETLERLLARADLRVIPVLRTPGDPLRAAHCLTEAFARLQARHAARRETAHAMEDLAGFADEGVTWRLGQAAAALDRAGRAELPPSEGDAEDRAELTARLDALATPGGAKGGLQKT